ncbi:serine hydroxymethyltransferase [Coxiella endosymbiont of Amblyomma americanum]|uniref:serine hydroxymethyltransferase n=1 Tax=Coxiella endosymbiont of Amblyomma americanum TaxID=325775 RepID=UPI00057E54E7|nr:serine hydroxymethyltransferase [Coxiella endosymbiont of Amblyomma americanum]AJC50285.1 serine hydroxymethyltransferase [Coxiella endosymbiont of Amblyomma americanum]AUJ58637.1 serine hydroxymethyltransferase [Coxiella-like endosymbiont of Amblyomma americanum]
MYDPRLVLESFDPKLFKAIRAEEERQERHIELIASENYVSPKVLELQGSVLTNKYAEGYPGRRYYGGCEFVDTIEKLAIDRAKILFEADYANVQPHSGSQANAEAYMALMNTGDTLLAMDLFHGGHLTHGTSVSFSGKYYKAIHYGLNAEGNIDYDQVTKLAKIHKPKVILAGFSAFSGIIDWQRFREIANDVNAYFMADIAHVAGLVAAGVYPSPVNIADVTTTTTHKTLRGPRSGLILAKRNLKLEKFLNLSVFPGVQGGPLMHVIAAKAVAFKEAMQPEFKTYAQQILKNAQVMANTMKERGYTIVSGGTQNHMFLVNLLHRSMSGRDAELVLSRANIIVNKNTVPGEMRSPFITSGLRIGTAAVTTRGFKEKEVLCLAHWICDILDEPNNKNMILNIKKKVAELTQQFPVYRQRRY